MAINLTEILGGAELAGGTVLAATGVGAPVAVPLLTTGAATLVSGINQGAQSNANSKVPPLTDPMQLKQLGEYDQKKKQLESGSFYGNEVRKLKNIQGSTDEGIIRAAGGGGGAAIYGLSKAQKGYGDALGDIYEAGYQRQDLYTQMAGKLTDDIAQRKLDIQTTQWTQAQLDATQKQNDNTQLLYNLLASNNLLGGKKNSPMNGTNTPNLIDLITGLFKNSPQTDTLGAGGFGNENGFNDIASLTGVPGY